MDFDYIQPPLAEGQAKCYDLLLTVLVTPRIPFIPLPEVVKAKIDAKKDTSNSLPPAATMLPLAKEENHQLAEGKQPILPSVAPRGVPSKLIRDFLDVFWRTMVPTGMDYRRDPDFMAMMKQLSAAPYVRCYDLPWVRPQRSRL